MSIDIDRRSALAATLLATTLIQGGEAMAQAQDAPPGYEPQALPFAPASIPGLSERLLTSHWQNNYGGAVRRLGAINAAISALDMSTAPGFEINGLKREELIAANSMILHEVYFASLATNGRLPGHALGRQIERDFGSHDRWRAEFVGMGKALGGGSGWVLLTWSPRLGRLANQWAFDHSMTLADGHALVALDMYEHAYHMDYGARAGDYVDAFMNVLNWESADDRFARVHREHS
jgi:superoxide dismutase, Fe-Mn family